jgi:creatinine amidohydrolase
LFNWFQGRRVKALSAELYGDAEGWHATPSEISLTWHAHPELARSDALDPVRAPYGDIRDAVDYRRQFADGRIGSEPGRARVEHGARLFEAGLADAMEAWVGLTERLPGQQDR